MSGELVRVLFVCTGNICRSPTAEAVFRALVQQQGLADRIEIDSAGTIGYHEGEAADPRSVEAASQRGVDMAGIRARRVAHGDYARYDFLLAMAHEHHDHMRRASPAEHRDKVHMFLSFAEEVDAVEVPDPYYGGVGGFDDVLDLVEAGAAGLLAHIRKHL